MRNRISKTARKRLKRFLSRWLPPLAVFAAVGGLYLGGVLDFLEYRFLDARFQILERAPSQSLVLVEIDAASLAELPTWPWPRSLHARLLENLEADGAERIALDIDFSSSSRLGEDAALAEALRAADPPVILPVFMQPAGAGTDALRLNAPLPAFAEWAELASINVATASDGRVRRLPASARWGELRPPSLFARLARPASAASSFYADYGIAVERIPRLSYADVLMRRYDPAVVEGRAVLVGATALELGDGLPVPLYGSLPGMAVQALGYESLVQGRALQRLAPEVVLALLLATAVVAMAWMKGRSWRGGLAALAVGVAGLAWASTTLQAIVPVILDTVPLLLGLALCFLVAQFDRIDRLGRRQLGYRRAAERRAAAGRELSESSFDGVLTLDRRGRVASANPAAARIFGRERRALVGRPVSELLPGFGDGARMVPGPSATPEQPPAAREIMARRGSGERIPVQVASQASAVSGGNVLLVHDLSAQRAAETAAAQAERRMIDLADRLDEGVALYDRRDRLRLCNDRYRALLLGPDASNPVGLRYGEILSAAADGGPLAVSPAGRAAWLEDRLRRHRAAHSLYDEPMADGRLLQVSEFRTLEGGTLVLCAEAGGPERAGARAETPTARSEGDAGAESVFLANVGHELRTPLNAIIGFSEVMLGEILGPIDNDSYKEYLRGIHGSGKHLLSVVNDILDISRIGQNSYTLEEEDLEPRALIEASARLVGQGRGRDIAIEVPGNLPALHGDERALKQVFRHILWNAVKFSPVGTRITVGAALSPRGELVVTIADDGIGIEPSQLETVMALFGQVESALSRSYQGLGLGLPLAKSLMELHGGSIALDSAPDQGTTVTLTFPESRVRRAAGKAAGS